AIAWPTLLSSSAFAQVLGGAAVPRNTPDYRTEGHTPSKFKVLYTFTGGADGGVPAAGLVFDTSGNAYGTTLYGGDLNCSLNPGGGCGTVFKLDPSGKETVLYAFTGGADGAAPAGDLLLDKEGNLYGTAAFGGHLTNCANGSG